MTTPYRRIEEIEDIAASFADAFDAQIASAQEWLEAVLVSFDESRRQRTQSVCHGHVDGGALSRPACL